MVITQPDYEWEMHKYKVNVGPAVFGQELDDNDMAVKQAVKIKKK